MPISTGIRSWSTDEPVEQQGRDDHALPEPGRAPPTSTRQERLAVDGGESAAARRPAGWPTLAAGPYRHTLLQPGAVSRRDDPFGPAAGLSGPGISAHRRRLHR